MSDNPPVIYVDLVKSKLPRKVGGEIRWKPTQASHVWGVLHEPAGLLGCRRVGVRA
jgi:hypothetical protein